MIVDDYLNLITSEYRDQPNYISMVSFGVSIYVYVQQLLASMIPLFDVDVAVGQQLDVIGQWAGVSRNVNIPISGVYFSWNSTASLGWNFGIWQSSTDASSVTVLPDDVYRTLIKAKIAANHWDGTTDGAYAIWDALFPNLTILIQDNQDMSYALGFVGESVDSLTLALITGGYIPLRPEGVLVSGYFFPIDSGPLFGLDIETDFVKGFDEGSFGTETLSS